MQGTAKRLPETIRDVEETIQKSLEALRGIPFSDELKIGLNYLLRPGYRPVVQLEEENGRKKRSTAAATNWNPDTGKVVIFFERHDAPMQNEAPCPNPPGPSTPSAGNVLAKAVESNEVTPLQIQQCCDVLADAEKAGKSFIALKWFRDDALAARHYDWTTHADDRQRVLATAIENGAIKTTRIPNPKNPQFPTTTVALNRTESHPAITPRYSPVPVRGEPVSYTLMRDRGSL